MMTRSSLGVSSRTCETDCESTTISKKTWSQLQDREAQQRCARDLQKAAP